ncbi:hypothetical protein [Luteimicrobium sp. DT211]|uniref:hypothetical protein n=1 Tax=Luteimicrobium sp. DT211 TaxID=3393412 RepID=UPI003CF8402C
MGSVTALSLALPDGWHEVPSAADEAWARELAAGLAAGAAVGVAASLAEDLARVVEVLRPGRSEGALGAVLVRQPESGLADAMVAVTVHRGVTVEGYELELDAVVEDALASGAVFAQAFGIDDVPAGPARGAHLVATEIAEQEEDDDAVLPVLQERVVVSVFPHGTPDMVEVLVLPDSMSTFADTVAEAASLCGGLRVSTQEAPA